MVQPLIFLHRFTAYNLQRIFLIKYNSLKNKTSKYYNPFFTKLICCLSEHVGLMHLNNFLQDLVMILFGADISTEKSISFVALKGVWAK